MKRRDEEELFRWHGFLQTVKLKMIQELLVQLFKIYIAFVIINSGIQTILHYTMEPLMLAGTDFADAILIEAAPSGEI